MTLDEAVILVGSWPANRSVPRLLAQAVSSSRGEKQVLMGQMVEVLMAASKTEQDFALIERYFG